MKWLGMSWVMVGLPLLPLWAMEWHTYKPSVVHCGNSAVVCELHPELCGRKSCVLHAETIDQIEQFVDQALVKKRLMSKEMAEIFIEHCSQYGKSLWIESPNIKDAVLWMLVFHYNKGWCSGTGAIEELLNRHHANPNTVDSFGCSPLRSAFAHRNFQLVAILLAHKDIDPNSTVAWDASTVLHQVARFHGVEGKLECHCKDDQGLKLLLKHPAIDPTLKNSDGLTPVMSAIVARNSVFIEQLLSNHLNNPAIEPKPAWYYEVIDNDVIVCAIEYGNAAIMQLLLDAGGLVSEEHAAYARSGQQDEIADVLEAHLHKKNG